MINTSRVFETPRDTLERSDGWTRLVDLVETAAADAREEIAPARDMTGDVWEEDVVTRPPTIAKLKSVRRLTLRAEAAARPDADRLAGPLPLLTAAVIALYRNLNSDDGSQNLYTHSKCLRERIVVDVPLLTDLAD